MRAEDLWSVPGRAVVAVGLFEGSGLVAGQFQLERGDGFGQVVRSGRADDGGADGRVAQHPGKRDLGHGDAASVGELLHCVYDRLVQG